MTPPKALVSYPVLFFLFTLLCIGLNSETAWTEDCANCTPPPPEISPINQFIPLIYQVSAPPLSDTLNKTVAICTHTSSESRTVSYCINENEIRRFDIRNEGSPKINPQGHGAFRTYSFIAPESARQDLSLEIEESGCTKGSECNDSEWTMGTILLFFPRKTIPSIRKLPNGDLETTLPTDEKVTFDGKTGEISGGVLSENAPMDYSTNRHSRKFCNIGYSGKGILVRSDQRGDNTRSSVVWGQKKMATITWGKKICKVSPAEIWEQKEGSGNPCRFGTDASFYSMLNKKCNWNVSEKDFQ